MTTRQQMIPSTFLPSIVMLFFFRYGTNPSSKCKTVPRGVSNEDNPRMRGISLESKAAFRRCENWKCVKLKCPEIKMVAYTLMSCNKLKAEESGSLRQPGQLNWGCIRRPLGKNWTNHPEFCPGSRGSIIFSVRFAGSLHSTGESAGNWAVMLINL